MFRRVGIGVIDQVLSSTSNFITAVVAARYLDKDAFGAFALAIVAYTMNLLIVRALCSEAILVRPGEGDDDRRARAASVVGAAVWVGVVLGAAYVVVGLNLDSTVRGPLIVLGLLTPGLLAQDTMRYVSFAQGRPLSAVINDGFWLVSQFLVLAVLLWLDLFDPSRLLAGWGLAGITAGFVQMRRDRLVPALGHGFRWIRSNRDLSARYLMDMISGQGASLLASYVLAGVAGVAAVGSIRGAQTLFGPVNIVLLGSMIVLVPEGRRIVAVSAGRLLTMCVIASGLFASVASLVTVALMVTPSDVGSRVLGSTWTGAHSVILPVGLAAVAGGVLAGAFSGLRSIAAADAMLRTRLITTPAALALPIGGALLAGANGLAYGVALSVWWNVIWFWRTFNRALKSHSAAPITRVETDVSMAQAPPDLAT